MNKCILVGNLTRDPEQRTTQNDIAVTSFTVAVNRRFKSADGSQQTDFINCVAWRQTAGFIAKYFIKGSRIGIVGGIRSRSYDDANGNRKYVTEVVVDEAEFVTGKGGGHTQPQPDYEFTEESDGFEPMDDDAELPF